MEENPGRKNTPAAAPAEPGFEEFEQGRIPRERAAFRLYVAGGRSGSLRAITALKALCDEHLAGQYEFEIIDIYQQPELAAEADIVAAPTLVKKHPLPLQRFVGDLSDTRKVLSSLASTPTPAAEGAP